MLFRSVFAILASKIARELGLKLPGQLFLLAAWPQMTGAFYPSSVHIVEKLLLVYALLAQLRGRYSPALCAVMVALFFSGKRTKYWPNASDSRWFIW